MGLPSITADVQQLMLPKPNGIGLGGGAGSTIASAPDKLTVDLSGNVSIAAIARTANAALSLANNVGSTPPSIAAIPFFSDTFTAADGTNITAHTPEVGGAWTVPQGGWQISNNQAQSSSNGTNGAIALQTTVAPGLDNLFTCDVINNNYGSLDGIIFRAVDQNNLYFGGWGEHNSGASSLKNGAEVLLGFGNGNFGSPRAIQVYVVGIAVIVFINGAVCLVKLLDSFEAATKFGLRMAGGTGVNKVDNLKGYAITQGTPVEKPVVLSNTPVLFDTDMGTDSDDAIALLLLHGLQSTSEANIVACTVCTGAANAVNATYAINSYKGRASIPLGVTKAPTNTATAGLVDTLATGSYGTPGPGLSAPDAVSVMRAALNNAPANGLVIIAVGFMTNLSNLLNSPANYGGDGISLTGLQLVAQKCKHLSYMGGQYGHGSSNLAINFYEYNSTGDTGATDNTLGQWPSNVPIFANGLEIGSVYQLTINTALFNATRYAIDPTSVLVGVRGTSWGGNKYYGVNQGRGYSQGGVIGYVPDPTGNFFVLRESASPIAAGGIAAQMTALCGT